MTTETIDAATDTAAATHLWAKLREPLARADLQWRVDGKPTARDGKFYARAVCWADVPAVVHRLEAVVPGEWDLTAGEPTACTDAQGVGCYYVKARLQILGVIREDVGQGPDPKQAHTDAIKRVARLFGVGLHLWEMGQVWVQVDGDGRFAKIVGDPWAVWDRQQREARTPGVTAAADAQNALDLPASKTAVVREPAPRQAASRPAPSATPAAGSADDGARECPKCGKAPMYDNRLTKKNPKAPDFRCRDRSCEGVVWPDAGATKGPATQARDAALAAANAGPLGGDDDEMPF